MALLDDRALPLLISSKVPLVLKTPGRHPAYVCMYQCFLPPPKFGGGERFSDFAPPKISRLGGASPPKTSKILLWLGGGVKFRLIFFEAIFLRKLKKNHSNFILIFFLRSLRSRILNSWFSIVVPTTAQTFSRSLRSRSPNTRTL